MMQCSTPLTRAMVQNEVDQEELIKNCYATAINYADSIYGNKNMIDNEYPLEDREEIYAERRIVLDNTMKFLYDLALKEKCIQCLKQQEIVKQ